MGNIIPGPPTLRDGSIRPDAKDSTLEFWWEEPPGQLPPAEVSSYTLSCSSIPFSQSVTSSTLYIKVSSLMNDTEYSFQITAANSNGESIPAYFRTVQPGLVPNPVANPTATVLSNAVVQIGWEGPTPDPSIPSTGWFVVQSVSSSPSDPEFRVSAYATASTAVISSLNTASMYAFNVYAVNDPGYSVAVSTIVVSPVTGTSDLYTYFDIVTVSGSNDYYYRIYNSLTGWSDLLTTSVDSTQYVFNGSNHLGGGSNYLFASFFNLLTNQWAVPFFNTNGTPTQTITWDGTNENVYVFPNSFHNNTFFSASSNSNTGLYDLQLYQPTTGLYQSTSIVASYFTEGPAIYPVPLQNSIIFITGSMSNTLLNYIWPVNQSTPIFLYEAYGYGESEPYPVNSNTGMFNVASINNTDYIDTVNYISEPSTYTTYLLPPSTYTNYNYRAAYPYGNNNQNCVTVAFYNSNTTLYDIYVWNNVSNSSNVSNPVILSNMGANSNIFGFINYGSVAYEATTQTNVLLVYDFDSNTYTTGLGIGATYSVFDTGSTCSTSYTSTNRLFTNNGTNLFGINWNATAALQLDDMNNVSVSLCSQEVGQSTYILSSFSAYRTDITSNSIFATITPYTNFMSINIQLQDTTTTNFTFQTDTGAITLSTNGIGFEYYSGSTGYVMYNYGIKSDTADVLQNGVVTYTDVYRGGDIENNQPDFGLGIIYNDGYDVISMNASNFIILTVPPSGPPTSTILAFSQGSDRRFATPSSFYACANNPFTVLAQTLDNSQYVHSTFGFAGNTSNSNFYGQPGSVLFNVIDLDTNSTIYVSFDETARTFREYTEQQSIVQSGITTGPYYWSYC